MMQSARGLCLQPMYERVDRTRVNQQRFIGRKTEQKKIERMGGSSDRLLYTHKYSFLKFDSSFENKE